MPSSSTSGCSSETSREKIGFSQIDSPTPWPYCRREGGLLVREAELLARPATPSTMSAVVAPGRTLAIARSMYSRARTYASFWARLAEPTANVR